LTQSCLFVSASRLFVSASRLFVCASRLHVRAFRLARAKVVSVRPEPKVQPSLIVVALRHEKRIELFREHTVAVCLEHECKTTSGVSSVHREPRSSRMTSPFDVRIENDELLGSQVIVTFDRLQLVFARVLECFHFQGEIRHDSA
jgi:hypothetical protein